MSTKALGVRNLRWSAADDPCSAIDEGGQRVGRGVRVAKCLVSEIKFIVDREYGPVGGLLKYRSLT